MELVQFLGCKGCYALFSIKREILPNGEGFDKILVAHEGHGAYFSLISNTRQIETIF